MECNAQTGVIVSLESVSAKSDSGLADMFLVCHFFLVFEGMILMIAYEKTTVSVYGVLFSLVGKTFSETVLIR